MVLFSCFSLFHIVGSDPSVKVFHLIDQKLFGETDGSVLEGSFTCPNSIGCEFISTDIDISGKELMSNLGGKYSLLKEKNMLQDSITVGLYSIHSWGMGSEWPHHPDLCKLPTMLSMAESEESHSRFDKLFRGSFVGYNGNSTTHPSSTVQRTYVTDFTVRKAPVTSALLLTPVAHNEKLPGAAYVASTCHGNAKHRPRREAVVSQLESSYRIDSLGQCHRTRATTNNPGAVKRLSLGKTDAETLLLKQQALSKYLFYLAFENTIEPGYVTEKVFDALIAGTVPIYLGDSSTCRQLLPHPKAAIFVDDYVSHHYDAKTPEYIHGIKALGDHLQFLTSNATAYHEHLAWRENFDISTLNPLLRVSWPCRVCQWAISNISDHININKLRKEKEDASKLCNSKLSREVG